VFISIPLPVPFGGDIYEDNKVDDVAATPLVVDDDDFV
jgi:hypothetical protein